MVNLPDYHEENDDEIILPADTLAILNEFWHEQAVLESNEIISNGGERTFGENWVCIIVIDYFILFRI